MKIDGPLPDHSNLQLAERLRKQIIAGEITSRFPSLTQLTAATGLAVGTVRHAVDVLALERMVRRVPGRGTFVVSRPTPSTIALCPPTSR